MLGKSLAAFLLTSVCLYSSPFVSPAIAADALKETGLASLLPVDAITKHHFSAGGHALAYTAHTGTLTLRDDEGKPAAKVFYVAYTQDGANLQKRPVSFSSMVAPVLALLTSIWARQVHACCNSRKMHRSTARMRL